MDDRCCCVNDNFFRPIGMHLIIGAIRIIHGHIIIAISAQCHGSCPYIPILDPLIRYPFFSIHGNNDIFCIKIGFLDPEGHSHITIII